MPVRVTPITAYAGYELAPTLSPDGDSVAFSWDGQDGNRDLYMTRIGGSGVAQLTDAAEPDRFPAWSPSGADIAILTLRARF
jgi:Tol biopolymer transport system component